MSKNKLFVDAVAEAKQLKETAIVQAKLAMAESFAPRVQSMVQTKLDEIADEEMNEEKSLEEILQEMESEEVPENPEDYTQQPGYIHEDEELEGEEGSSEEVAELTVDELKDVIRDVMAELEGSEEIEPEFEEEPEMEEPEMEDEEIDLDEILNEMGGTAMADPAAGAAAGADELLKMIKSAIAKAPELATKIQATLADLGSAAGAAMRSEAKELEESKKLVNQLKTQLSEVNLLNSKLIYVNKVFKTTNLTESKKVAVINAFDRATSVKEVENTFKTIKESITSTPTKPLHENRSFASKAAGVAEKQIITESTDFVARMQKLAGIKL